MNGPDDKAKPAPRCHGRRLQIDRLGGAIDPTPTPTECNPQDAAALAARTVERSRRWQRRLVSEAIEIGADLLRVKEALGHGKFTDWLRTEFGEVRTAQRLMTVAARFAGKRDTMSVLPLTTVYALGAPSTVVLPWRVWSSIAERVRR